MRDWPATSSPSQINVYHEIGYREIAVSYKMIFPLAKRKPPAPVRTGGILLLNIHSFKRDFSNLIRIYRAYS